MRYLKWKLSNGRWGTHPVETIATLGGRASTGAYTDGDGYRVAYLWEDIDSSQLSSVWDVTEVTETEALTFCQRFYAEAEVLADGRISNPPNPELPPPPT